MASKAAIKDVGTGAKIPYGDVEGSLKLIPPPIRGRNVSISQALETVPISKHWYERSCGPNLIDLALRLKAALVIPPCTLLGL